MVRVALAGTHIFAWIFAFQYFFFLEPDIAHALTRAILLYALAQTIACLATPFTVRYLRFGARRSLIIATTMAAAAFVLLGVTMSGSWANSAASYAFVAFAIAMGLYRALYWIPYEIESAVHVRKVPSRYRELLVLLAPLFGGLFVASLAAGQMWLLYGGAIILALSVIPLFFIRNIHERFSWGYRETFRRLFRIDNRRVVLESFLDGVSGAALLFFWPLAVFLILDGSYGMLGIVLSLTFGLTLLTRGVVRRQLQKLRMVESRLVSAALAITPWLFRFFVATPIGFVLVDAYFLTTTPRRMGVDAFAFEQVADGGSYIDEYTALKELSLSLGRISICLLGAVAVSFVSVPAGLTIVFLLAALSSAAGVLWLR